MINWADDINYSVNKNRRWELQDQVKQAFEDRALDEEPFDAYAMVAPDPNTIHQQKVKHGLWLPVNGLGSGPRHPKYFNSNIPLDDCLVKKSQLKRQSHQPAHKFSGESDIRMIIEDDESHANRRGLFKVKQDRALTKMSRKKAFSLDELVEDKYPDYDYEYDEELYADDADDDWHEPTISFILEDYIQNPVNARKDTIKEPATTSGVVNKKPFKGRIVYDPEIMFTEINNIEEEFEAVESYHVENDSVIVFLDNVPFELESWENISEDYSTCTTLFNVKLGILAIFADPAIINDDVTEFRLKIVCLGGDIDKSVLDIFAEYKNTNEICLLAEQMFSGHARQTVINKEGYSVFSRPLMIYNLLESNIAEFKKNRGAHNISDECQICYNPEKLTFSPCGEGFCSSCWAIYLSNQVNNQAGNSFISCPGYQCTAPVPLAILAWALPAEKMKASLDTTLDTIIKVSFNILACPSPNCSRVVRCTDDKIKEFKCMCGLHWCRFCRETYHAPSSCLENKEFIAYQHKLAKFKSLESVVEGRACPKCKTIWEKMWGCNYMLCSKCQTGFCWGCGNVHNSHYGNCGKINVPLEKIEILAFPTEDFPKSRIEAFNLSLKLRDTKLKTNRSKVINASEEMCDRHLKLIASPNMDRWTK